MRGAHATGGRAQEPPGAERETGKPVNRRTHISLSILLPASELNKRGQADSKDTFKDSLRNRGRDQRTAKKRQQKVFAQKFRQEEDQEKEREKMTQNRSGLQCDIERGVKVVVA